MTSQLAARPAIFNDLLSSGSCSQGCSQATERPRTAAHPPSRPEQARSASMCAARQSCKRRRKVPSCRDSRWPAHADPGRRPAGRRRRPGRQPDAYRAPILARIDRVGHRYRCSRVRLVGLPSARPSRAPDNADNATDDHGMHLRGAELRLHAEGGASICAPGEGRQWYHAVLINKGPGAYPECRATGFDAHGTAVFKGQLPLTFAGFPAGLFANAHRSTAFYWYLPQTIRRPVVRNTATCSVNSNPPT